MQAVYGFLDTLFLLLRVSVAVVVVGRYLRKVYISTNLSLYISIDR